MSGGGVFSLAKPVLRSMTLVLTNGASLRMPTILRKDRPQFADFDVYNHNMWQHKIETDASLEAGKNYLPDFSSFYGKFKEPAGKETPKDKQ
ncbi:MAG: hypothetical protein WDW38_010590 [Sanguina aurantia]